MEALRRNLACELGPYGIRVVTLQTGGVPETIPEGADGMEAIVNEAVFAASDWARTMTATALNITCGSVVD